MLILAGFGKELMNIEGVFCVQKIKDLILTPDACIKSFLKFLVEIAFRGESVKAQETTGFWIPSFEID